MGMNKAQKQAAERAKKATAPEVPAAVEEVKPVTPAVQTAPATATPAPAAQPVTPSKQMVTVEGLKAGWAAKGVNLDKLTVKDDGKFKLVVVAEGWPTVQIGPTGGITVVELKSYQKAFDAAMDGLNLFEKQKAREAKKAAAPAPAPKASPEAPAAPVAKESPTAKKAKQAEAIEQQLQSAVS